MNVTIDQLLAKIGALTIENDVLRAQVAALQQKAEAGATGQTEASPSHPA